jgi:glycosyltransferase involved in cell wall biosynthesis
MKDKKLKLVFLIRSYTEYNNDLFISLKKKYNVKVLLIFSNEKLTKFKYFDKSIYLKLKKKIQLIKLLTKLKPDIIIIGGYKISYADLAIKYSKSQNIKYFFWLEKINFNFIFKEFFFNIIHRNKLKKAAGILAVGMQAQNYYKNINNNTINFPYSINPKNFIFKQKINKKINKKIKILYVGQLVKRKGIQLILDSLKFLEKKIINNIVLTFVGNGPMKKHINTFSKIFPFVNLIKFQNKKNLSHIYSKNNIFLFPSIYDGWGVAPMEAMASGMAMIISKKVGCVENLRHKKNGLIINPNAYEISKAIKFYFKNKNKILEYGKNNINLISKSNLNSKLNALNIVKFLK